MSWIEDFTKNTPLQVSQVTEQFTRLKAFGLDPMDGTLQSLVDQNEKLGGGYKRLNGIVNAFGQAWAKQKLQGEEILQLIERGVPVWDRLSKVTGKSTAELQKMSTAGKLGRDVIKELYLELGRGAEGAAAANMSTMSGYLSNLTDQWMLFKREIAESGALDFAKEQLEALLARVQELKDNGKLAEYTQNISSAMVGMAKAIGGTVQLVARFSKELLTLGAVMGGAKLLGVAAKLTTGMGSLGLSLRQSAATARLAGRSFSVMGAAMKAIPGTLLVTLGIVGLRAALSGMDALIQKMSGYTASQERLAQSERNFQMAIEQRMIKYERLADAMQQAASLEIKSAEQLRQLSDEQREAYEGKLDALREYYRLRVVEQRFAIQAGQAEQAALDQALAKYNSLTDATENLAKANEYVADAVRRGLTVAAAEAVDEFRTLNDEGMSAADALKTVAESMNVGNPRDMQNLNAVLQEVSQNASLTADEISSTLTDAIGSLAAGDVERLKIALRAAFEDGQKGSDVLAALLRGPLAESFKGLGISAQSLATGMSDATNESIAQFEALRVYMRETGKQSEEAGQQVVDAWRAAYDAAESDKGRNALVEQLKAAQAEGLITEEVLEKALSRIEGAGEDAGRGIERGQERAQGAIHGTAQAARDTGAAMAEMGQKAQALGDLVAQYINSATAEVSALGAAARASFQESLDLPVQPILDDVEALRQGIETAQQALATNVNAMLTSFDASGVSQFAAEVEAAKNQTIIAFNQQQLAYRNLMDEISTGALQGDALVTAAERAKSSMDLLDDASLNSLNSAISSAQSQMEAFGESANNTLVNLQNELDRLRGNTEAVDRRRAEQQKAELQAQIEQARALGDQEALADLNQALAVLEQINTERRTQAAEQAKEDAAKAAQTVESEKTTADSTARPSTESGQRIDLNLPGGITSSISGDPADINNLLDYLSQAGLRTTE